MVSTRIFIVLVVLCLAVSDAIAAASQEAPPTTITTIPAKDIPSRADVDDKLAMDVISRAGAESAVNSLDADLEALASAVHEQNSRFTSEELHMLPALRLESLARHWKFRLQQFENWRTSLRQKTQPYLDDAEKLARRKTMWTATRDTPEVQNGPAALRERIDYVLQQISRAEQAISGQLEKYIQLGQQATATEVEIQAGLQQVASAIDYSDQRLMELDSTPLWQRDTRAQPTAEFSTARTLNIEADFARDYTRANKAILRTYHLFELALLPLFIWLSFRSRTHEQDDFQTQAAARVLQRPFSAWLLLVMSAVLITQSDAPILLHQLVLFAALVPVLRLLPPRVYEVLGYWPYIISGLYLLDIVGFFIAADPFYHRWYLLFLAMLATILVGYYVHRGTSAAQQLSHKATSLLLVTGWIAIALFTIAIVLNVIGNATLAEMLVSALIFSAYLALVLYAGIYAITSLLYLLIKRTTASGLRTSIRYGGSLLQGLTSLLKLFAFIVWLAVTLDQLRVLTPVYGALKDLLTSPLSMGEISITLGGTLLFGFSVWLAYWVAKAVRVILSDEILPTVSLPRGVAHSISSLTYYALIIAGLLIALAAAGFEVSQLTIVIGALGVGIGLGLQSVVNNFVSGLILMFERPIQPGDVVEITGTNGKVREIGMRATTISTFDGADVIVPNGTLLSEKLINWTLNDTNRRIEVNASVAYGSDPKRVLEILLETTRSTPGIITHPEPAIVFSALGNSALEFIVRAWSSNFSEWVNIRSDLTLRIHDALTREGIEIPFPQYDLHVRTIAPEAMTTLDSRWQKDRPPGQ